MRQGATAAFDGRRRWLFTVVSVAVTVGVFGYLLRHVSLAQVLELIRNADAQGIVLFLMLSLSQSGLRTWRYRLLLRFSGVCPGAVGLFLVVLVRNFTSDLLPARLGALAYIFVVNTRLGVPLVPATSSFALVFLLDILAIVPLLLVALLLMAGAAALPTWPLLLAALLLAVLTFGLTLVLPRAARQVAGWLRGREPGVAHWRTNLAERAEQVAGEIERARLAGLYGPVLTLSVLVRLAKYGSLYVFLYALLHPLGYGWSDLYPPKIFLGLCASELAASLPISGIAAFGAYEGAWAAAFQALGFPGDLAKLTAISHHLFTQTYGYSLGALAFAILLLPIFKVAQGQTLPTGWVESPPRFYLKVALSVALLAAVLWGLAQPLA